MPIGEPLSAMLHPRFDEVVQDSPPILARVFRDGERPCEHMGRHAVSRVPERLAGLPSSAIHELRTPLTSIHGYAQVLQRGLSENPRASNALSVIVRESGRLTQMLAELSDLAELVDPDERATVPAPTEVDVREVAEIVAESIAAHDTTGHEIVVTGRARLACDSRRLALALTHVLNNAASYSPAETQIAVNIDDGEDCVRIYVADEGIGISDADAERIYQPFERGANARELGARGLGLGLHIARQALARLDGGTLSHLPQPSGGTIFMLELPRI